MVLNHFAPVKQFLGLHWSHFDNPILPPIIPQITPPETVDEKKIIVYLPFENLDQVEKLLSPFKDYEFHIYGQYEKEEIKDNLHCSPCSRQKFIDDLLTCHGVICNAGFELPSEALHLGKKVIVKPLKGQIEQVANAIALKRLKLSHTMNRLSHNKIEKWLDSPGISPQNYPNVALEIVKWIEQGDFNNREVLVDQLWNKS